MGKKSRDKGKIGEREVAQLFRNAGYPARRTAQVDGGLSADVLVPSLPWLHVESKRYKGIAACRFMDQAIEDAKDKTPVVFMREDKGPWIVMMLAHDWLRDIALEGDTFDG